MLWNLTILVVHIAALIGVALLIRHTPDKLQKGIIWVLLMAMVIYIGSDIAVLAGVDKAWMIRLPASRVEHFAVLLWLVRQVWIKTELCKSLKSSRLAAT